MPIDHVFRATPQLGPALLSVDAEYWFLPPQTNTNDKVDVSYRLGNVEKGTDGHDYVMVVASADIAATATTGTQVTITEPAFTAATGSGGWFTPPGVAITLGQYFQARRQAL